MRIVKRLFDFYLNSSLHVAFAVWCLLYITHLTEALPYSKSYGFTVFLGTVIGYNFLKYIVVFLKEKWDFDFYGPILLLSGIAGIGLLYFVLDLPQSVVLQLVYLGALLLVYPYLRRFGWLKFGLVVLVVTYVTVYIPYQSVKWLPWDYYISLLQRVLILSSLLIPFEIMDSTTDPQSMNTLPHLLGIKATKILGILVVVPFLLLEFFKAHPSYAVVPIALITVFSIRFTSLKRSPYYTSFWVESIPIVWLFLVWVLH
jgi:hypothetical protein